MEFFAPVSYRIFKPGRRAVSRVTGKLRRAGFADRLGRRLGRQGEGKTSSKWSDVREIFCIFV